MAKSNLIPVTERSKEEARALSKKGGINSGKARRVKRLAKDVASLVMSLQAPITEQTRKTLAKRWAVDEEDIDVLFVSITSLASKAMKGDVKAFEVVRDTMGEKPGDNVKLTHEMGDGAVILIGYDD